MIVRHKHSAELDHKVRSLTFVPAEKKPRVSPARRSAFFYR